MLKPILILSMFTGCTWITNHPTEVKLAEDIAEAAAEEVISAHSGPSK